VGLAVIVVMWIGFAGGLIVAAVSWVRQRAD
jgi:hypothetical protein